MPGYKLTIKNAKVVLKTIADYIINLVGIKDNNTGTGNVTSGFIDWKIQHYSDTAANFTSLNPVLLVGQLGIETDALATSPKFKIGDGLTAWNSLPYVGGSSLGYTPEDVANKSTNVNTDKASSTKYPSVKAVYDWATGLFVKKGTLTTNYIQKATASDTIGNSAVYEDGSGFGVTYGGQDIFYADATEAFIGLSTNEFVDVIAARTELKHSAEIKLNAPIINAAQLIASQIVETDASKNLVSAAKGTAYNKNFGTGTTNIPEIGTTLTADKVLITDASSKLKPSTISTTTLGYLDATSSIQTQLDAKSSNLLGKSNTNIAHTGTTSETIVWYAEIEAGIVHANDILRLLAFVNATNNANAKTIRIKINDTLDLSGATQFATCPLSSNYAGNLPFCRNIIFQNSVSSQRTIGATANITSDEAVISGYNTADSTYSLNFGTKKFIMLTFQLANSGDVMNLRMIKLSTER